VSVIQAVNDSSLW